MESRLELKFLKDSEITPVLTVVWFCAMMTGLPVIGVSLGNSSRNGLRIAHEAVR
jgi:hypothetical protein